MIEVHVIMLNRRFRCLHRFQHPPHVGDTVTLANGPTIKIADRHHRYDPSSGQHVLVVTADPILNPYDPTLARVKAYYESDPWEEIQPS